MKLNAQDLKEIVTLTLEHYKRAEEFWTGTRDHDVSQNIAAMLQYMPRSHRSAVSLPILERVREPRYDSTTLQWGPK
jgi:hypothetical protein